MSYSHTVYSKKKLLLLSKQENMLTTTDFNLEMYASEELLFNF